LTSYSLYTANLDGWYRKNVAEDFPEIRAWAMEILQKEAELQEIVQLVGSDALPEEQKLTLEIARMIREIFLQQNAYHPVDTYTPLARQYTVMKTIKRFGDLARKALEGDVPVDAIVDLPVRNRFTRSKLEPNVDEELEAINKEMDAQFESLGGKT
ncbi:MAG: V-type ATP synthase subunit A, partial [Euryarchaeota archaeon]|nr:V-type ATP synthase subunit A [Euryarchaeota archaeon]